MTIRSCIYKSCENFVNLKCRTSSDVKFFSFPKNPERRQKWMELGQVPINLPESLYYFCADHFDKKFVASCNKRTVLVGEAVPFPYVEPESEDTHLYEDHELNLLLCDLDSNNADAKHKYSEEPQILVESTTATSETEDNINQNLDYEEKLDNEHPEEYIFLSDEEEFTEESTKACNSNKRKVNIELVQATSSKQKRVVTPSQERKTLQNNCEIESIEQNVERNSIFKITRTESSKEIVEDINAKVLVDAQHVTTFIFKGEEYVQMPKEHYINEKVQLMKKIQKMETTLRAIRGNLNSLDLIF